MCFILLLKSLPDLFTPLEKENNSLLFALRSTFLPSPDPAHVFLYKQYYVLGQ